MNWGNRKVQREDGTVSEDQRRLGFGGLVDHAVPVAILGLLAWLCLGMMTLQQQVAVLVERTTNQTGRVDRITSDIQGIQTAQAEMQRELEEVKRR